MGQGDLERPDLNELSWSVESRSDSLSAVFDHSTSLARGAEQWYATERRSKKVWGKALRVGAIVLAAVAAVLPVLSEIYSDEGRSAIAPAWATVVLAAAATLIALDRYFGLSTGWTRFMTAELQITRLRHDFEYAWQEQRAAATSPLSDNDVAALLAMARKFVVAVDNAIVDETRMWTAEFQASLQQAEQSLEGPKGTGGR